jgi:hypothetical protein
MASTSHFGQVKYEIHYKSILQMKVMQMKIVQLQIHKKNVFPIMKAVVTNNIALGCLV